MKTLGFIFLGVIVLAAAFGMTWAVQGNDFFLFKVFAPKYEAVRRETFEESKAYNQGMIQELQTMRLDYAKATPEHKKAIASIVLHRVADYDRDKLPRDLRDFVNELERERSR